MSACSLSLYGVVRPRRALQQRRGGVGLRYQRLRLQIGEIRKWISFRYPSSANKYWRSLFLGPPQKLFQSKSKTHRAPGRGADSRGPRQGSGPDLHRHEGQDRVLQLQEPREASAPLQMGGHQRHLQRLEDKVRGVTTFTLRG